MSKEEIKPGDKILYPSPYARNPGPFKVLKVDKDGIIRVLRRSKNGKAWTDFFVPEMIVKLRPGEKVRQAFARVVPPEQRCELCGYRPALERHFTTVPFPKAFIRSCMTDYPHIQKAVRELNRRFGIVEAVLEAAKRNPDKPETWQLEALKLIEKRLRPEP